MDRLPKEALEIVESNSGGQPDANHPESEFVNVVEDEASQEQDEEVERLSVCNFSKVLWIDDVVELVDKLPKDNCVIRLEVGPGHGQSVLLLFIKGSVVPAPIEAMPAAKYAKISHLVA